jgi:hypothetical protein
MGVAVLKKALVKATSNVGDVFQPEFEGHLVSLEGNFKCA